MYTVLIKFQYQNNHRQTRLSLFVHLASTSHKVGKRRISFGKVEESKRSLRVLRAFSIATWLLPVMAQQTTKKLRCEAAKHRRKEEKAEEYLTSQALTVSRDVDGLWLRYAF